MFNLLTGTIDLVRDETVVQIDITGQVGDEGSFHIVGVDTELLRELSSEYEAGVGVLQGQFEYVAGLGFFRLLWIHLSASDCIDTDYVAPDLMELVTATPQNEFYFENYGLKCVLSLDVRLDDDTELSDYLPIHNTYPVVYGTDRHYGAVNASTCMRISRQATITLVSKTDATFKLPLLGDAPVLHTTLTFKDTDTYGELITAVAGAVGSIQVTQSTGYSKAELVPDLKKDCVAIGQLMQLAIPKLTHVWDLPAVTAYIQLY